MQAYDDLVTLVQTISQDISKAEAGNYSAGTRIRKQMQAIRKAAFAVREEILALREAKKGKDGKSHSLYGGGFLAPF